MHLYFQSDEFDIEKSYGTDYDEKTGLLQKIDTLIASAKDERGVKGGLMLFKIKEKEKIANSDNKGND